MNETKQYFILIKDNKTKKFNIIGPTPFEDRFTNKVSNMQKEGYPYTMDAVEIERNTKEEIIEQFITEGYTYDKKLFM